MFYEIFWKWLHLNLLPLSSEATALPQPQGLKKSLGGLKYGS